MRSLPRVIQDNYKILLISLIVVLVFWFLVFPKLNEKKEHMMPSNNLHKFAGKTISLTHNLDTGLNFLAVTNVKSCSNIKYPVCKDNMVILQPTQNSFSTFRLIKKTSEEGDIPTYYLQSIHDNTIINQDLYKESDIPYLCSSKNAKNIEIIIEELNIGYILKVITPVKYRNEIDPYVKEMYFSLCEIEDGTCVQGSQTFKRICLTSDKNKAIIFGIIDAPITENFSENNDSLDLDNSPDSLNSILDMYSLYSHDSAKSFNVSGIQESYNLSQF